MKITSAPLTLDSIPTPTAPPTGASLYFDSSDSKLKIIKSDATTVPLESNVSDQTILAFEIFT